MSQPPQDASTKPPLPTQDGPSLLPTTRPTVTGFEIKTVLDLDTNQYMVLLVLGTLNIKAPPQGAQTLGLSLIEAAYHARSLNEKSAPTPVPLRYRSGVVEDVTSFLREQGD